MTQPRKPDPRQPRIALALLVLAELLAIAGFAWIWPPLGLLTAALAIASLAVIIDPERLGWPR